MRRWRREGWQPSSFNWGREILKALTLQSSYWRQILWSDPWCVIESYCVFCCNLVWHNGTLLFNKTKDLQHASIGPIIGYSLEYSLRYSLGYSLGYSNVGAAKRDQLQRMRRPPNISTIIPAACSAPIGYRSKSLPSSSEIKRNHEAFLKSFANFHEQIIISQRTRLIQLIVDNTTCYANRHYRTQPVHVHL